METNMILIIVAVILVSISLSVGIYFATKKDDTATPAAAGTSPSGTPAAPATPPPAPTTNWAGYSFSTNGRCGPDHGNTACSGKACCSRFGWCGGSTGGNDDWCGTYKGYDGKYNAERP